MIFINQDPCKLNVFICTVAMIVLFQSSGVSQHVYNHEIKAEGQIYLTDEIQIPEINPGYTVWVPQNPSGLVIFTHARRDTVKSDTIIDECLKNGMAIIYATTSNRLEFLFEEERKKELATYIEEVFIRHQIPEGNVLICGMSLEGTRALILTSYMKSKGMASAPTAVAICDAPLDMTRFYYEGKRAEEIAFHPASTNEGKWVSSHLENNLGGTPAKVPQNYVAYSPFTYTSDDGGNAGQFLNIHLWAYTEPDVKWWIENRGKDYYGMNSTDLAALVNQLRLSGNKNAELIITENKGYRPDGARHPHSWSIVDEKELISWFSQLIKK